MKEIRTPTEDKYYKEVKTGKFYDVITYETEDGQTFPNKASAVYHESELHYNAIQRTDIDIPEFGWQWYKAKNEEELVFLKKYLHDDYDAVHGIERIKVGEWFSFNHEDGGDYRGVDYFYTLQDFKQFFKDTLNKLQ